MLGWVLSRNAANALADDSQLEPPDTPAPVFAARALKTAIFGTPAPASETTAANVVPHKQAPAVVAAADDDAGLRSPAKPQGILLTPGTATARRKRVSFGHDVKDVLGKDGEKAARNKVAEALEKSRKRRDPSTKTSRKAQQAEAVTAEKNAEPVEGVQGGDDYGDPDITMDLNEPRSGSGKYWKSSFETYHSEAKLEMEKLVKYKQLAKSYAKMKDAESLKLNERLDEEQEKVRQMERKVNELAQEMLKKQKATVGGKGAFDEELMDKLQRQSKLTSQYQTQVKELESMLAETKQGAESSQSRRITSPRTQKTLMETQRELRRARASVKELASLREELSRLKTSATGAEEKTRELKDDNRKLAEDLLQSRSEIRQLRMELTSANATIARKDGELAKLQAECDALKAAVKTRRVEAEDDLRKKNEVVADSRREQAAAAKVEVHFEKSSKLQALEDKLKKERERRLEERSALQDPDAKSEFDADAFARQLREPRRPARSSPLLEENNDQENKRASSASLRLDAPAQQEKLKPRSAARTQRSQPDAAEEHPNVLTERVNLASRRSLTSETPRQRQSSVTAKESHRHSPGLLLARSTTPLDDLPEMHSAYHQPTHVDARQEKVDASIGVLGKARVNMPPERRAAAEARVQKRMAERERMQRRSVRNKENVVP